MKLGERLRKIRKENNLTLKKLSQVADLSVPYLSDVERGTVNPSIETLQKIARAYDMSVKELLSDVDDLGKSLKVSYPEGFDELLEEYSPEINEDWKDLLLRISLRGKRPSTKREWVELYLHLRRILDPVVICVHRHACREAVKKEASTVIPTVDEMLIGLGLDMKEGKLPPDKDGALVGNTIIINIQIQSEERKQFTRFHEITHHLINQDGELISILHDATWHQKEGVSTLHFFLLTDNCFQHILLKKQDK